MKYIVISLIIVWIIGYLVATYHIVKIKKRIPMASIILLYLTPFLWIFFIDIINRLQSPYPRNHR